VPGGTGDGDAVTAPERSDAALLADVAAGDRRALEALYRRHAPWLLARLARRCSDPGVVDEVLQDAFVAAAAGSAEQVAAASTGTTLATTQRVPSANSAEVSPSSSAPPRTGGARVLDPPAPVGPRIRRTS
jgi:hypothetical protein